MAYTIKGLAKANECDFYDEMGLANIWDYWLTCNVNDMQCVNDFKSLRKSEQKKMLEFLQTTHCFRALANHIARHLL